MKTKENKKAGKSIVQQMRDIRDKVNLDIKDLTFEQLKEYLKKQKTLHNERFGNNRPDFPKFCICAYSCIFENVR
jgi:hypothetical protein